MKTGEMDVIKLHGSPRARGLEYGKRYKNKISLILKAWKDELGSFGLEGKREINIDVDDYLQDFYLNTHYLEQIKHICPHLLEEIEGISEGSQQPLKYVLALNLMDEEWIFGIQNNSSKPADKCTAFGVPAQKGRTGFAGQNMDIGSWVDGSQVLLRLSAIHDQPEVLIFSVAGCIGLNGFNSSGLGVTCNTLTQLRHCVDGLPVIFIVRSLLEKNSIDEAEEFLRTIKHASGQNYILSSKNEMRCFECCGTSVVQYKPEYLRGRVFHTNHPLVNYDFSEIPELNHSSISSLARLDSITDRLGQPFQLLVLDDIKLALAAKDRPDYPVCRTSNPEGSSIGFTAGSSIYEFASPPRLHLAAGPPCVSDFQTYEFTSSKE